MDYDKVYFPKTEMSQLVPTGYFSPETYAAYAESFDLSLLPTDSEPSQFEFNQCQSISEFISLDYLSAATAQIPIFNNNNDDNHQQQEQQSILMTIKTEKDWSIKENNNLQLIDNNNNNNNNKTNDIITSTTDSSILLQQLQKQYQFYPSPLPSPPQYDFNHNITIPITHNNINNNNNSVSLITQLPPSPIPSPIEQSTSSLTNFNTFSIKKEYLILPPSPPESNGAPSPFNDIKSEPDIDTENFIDINTLLQKSLINFDTTITTPATTATTAGKQLNSEENLLRKKSTIGNINNCGAGAGGIIIPQDHQVLREYLQDTTFQKKHNLKPLALESLIGGFSVRGDIEPVISLALEHAKRDAQATCANLQISLDPQQWTTTQVHSWIRSTIEQFKLSQIDNLENKFPENGANLLCLTEEEFLRRVPESGGTIHAQLEIWKLACCENFLTDMSSLPLPTTSVPSTSNWISDCNQNMDISDDEDDDLPSSIITSSEDLTTIITNGNTINTNSTATTTSATMNNSNNNSTNNNNNNGISPTSTSSTTTQTNPSTSSTSSSTTTTTTAQITPKPPRTGGSHIHLWQFLKELLSTPQLHGTAIRWLDRNKGVFKIEDSVRVAKLWGRRKNRPAMNYDKLSRSIRQYYKKGIMKKTERSQRLVYQFCHPYCL